MNTMIAVAVFVFVYLVIMLEEKLKVNRALAAGIGAAVLVATGVLSQEEAIDAIDFNVIGLLMGMMLIVGITKRTGVFQYLGVRAAKMAKGSPWGCMALLSLVTAVTSAFLDNVTTVILLVPVTLMVVSELELDPFPFLFAETFASNVGGTATLIGDPPNIMIGSAADLDFLAFIVNLTPTVVLAMAASLVALWFVYGRKLFADDAKKSRIMAMDENAYIHDKALLKKSLVVLACVILMFLLHSVIHFEVGLIAMTGAAALLVVSGLGAGHGLTRTVGEEVDWSTLLFFGGLFIIVGSLQKQGVIGFLAEQTLTITGGDPLMTMLGILWGAAILSAVVDNIPFTAAMIPLIKDMGAAGMNIFPQWWALSLGACLGGNGTLIGASANVVIAGKAAQEGHPISFLKFTKVGFPLMLLTLVCATVGTLVMYYVSWR